MQTITAEDQSVHAADKVTEKRTRLYVKRHFQQSMVLEVMLITFILINVIVTTTFWMMDAFVDVQQTKEYLAYTIAALEVVGFIGIYRYNLKASHRIAGPIFSAERSLQQIADGDLNVQMRLREHDRFPELAEQINQTADALRDRIAHAQTLAHSLRNDQDPETLAALIDALDEFDTSTSQQR
jgi:methyl-accepting chemotaxis protein